MKTIEIKDENKSAIVTKNLSKTKKIETLSSHDKSVAFINDNITDLCDVTKILITDYNR